jgi:GNAT superfamily N-acetyltransferase
VRSGLHNDAMTLAHRLATIADLDALSALMDRAIGELQRGYLDDAQIAASRAIMGIDRQLIDDGTYFLVTLDGALAGCGGWSRRATLYGGHAASHLRQPRLLDAATEPARIRAMYTDPACARRGVGRHVIAACEAAARAAGFNRAQLMATLSGEPLYRASGYVVLETISDSSGGAAVPLLRMEKPL